MTDFCITKHEWSDDAIASCKKVAQCTVESVDPSYGVMLKLKKDANPILTSSDTRALCQHFYGFDPETLLEHLLSKADCFNGGYIRKSDVIAALTPQEIDQ